MTFRQTRVCRLGALALFLIAAPACALAQSPAAPSPQSKGAGEKSAPANVDSGSSADEQRTSRAFEAARKNPADLENFLLRMPKGADLHIHLTGAVYAESFIRAGAEDGLCVDLASHSFAQPKSGSACAQGEPHVAQAYADQHLYDALVDAFSMRGFVPATGLTAHDHFFDTFDKFGGTDPRHLGEWLDEIATRAAAQNEQYLELMYTPSFSHAASLAKQFAWSDDLNRMREELIMNGLRDDIAPARDAFDRAEALRRQRERCGAPDETPACSVSIRYIYQVLRGFPKEQVFAQTLLGFETAMADPRFVGINYVMPEDGRISMTDYALHMRIVGFLHHVYPDVHISLHAGELAPGLVPYEGLCCHIRLAVEQAHAERIGHGVDIMYEDRPFDLLREMAAKHLLVEINLTSNDVILGVTGKDHPLPLYRRFDVPVALSTDDEGVSRINLTHEFVRAANTYNLTYADFKQMVRDSIEHSFLPGASLWDAPENFTRTVSACSGARIGQGKPVPKCAQFLQLSEKARQQWELEGRFRAFESGR